MNNFFKYKNNIALQKGCLLLSEPYLHDPNFERTVILICEHNDEGSFGLVVNKLSTVVFSDVIEDVDNFKEQLFVGGPVQQDTLHYVYKGVELEGAVEVAEGLYWGGNFEQLLSMINTRNINTEEFRFFLGYSGWSAGQLASEIKENSWIVSKPINANLLINTKSEDLWKKVLQQMGGKYEMYANYPIDPRMN